MMDAAMVTREGDLRLPPKLAVTLNAKPGDCVDVETGRDGTIRLHPKPAKVDSPADGGEVAVSMDFWKSPTLEELALSQKVRPMTDVRALSGTWPGDVDDGFEDAIEKLRHQGMERDSLS